MSTVALVAIACGREGLIATLPTNEPASRLAPIAIPSSPERDDTPFVWTQRSDKTAIRVVMTPGRPIVGEWVRFDINMTFDDPPYRPGVFNYDLLVEGVGGETSSASCGVRPVPVGFRPKPPKSFDDNLRRKYRIYDSGPHEFSIDARPSCNQSAAGVSITRTFVVRGARPVEGLHRTGSDGQRQVDLLISPDVTKEDRVAHLYAIFEDLTGEPFSWRISFGDGTRPAAGGPACKPGASRGGRYARRLDHKYDVAAEYVLNVEVSPLCLSDARRRGAVVISERLYVRPWTISSPRPSPRTSRSRSST